MTIYVTGDLHGTAEYGKHRFSTRMWPRGKNLTHDDTVIICGDFGYVWDGSKTDDYWLDWLEDKPWTTCFCDGNHENHVLLAGYPAQKWHGGMVGVIRPHVLHLKRGEIFEIEDKRIFVMGGARSHDIEWRKEGVSWWPEELPSETEIEYARENLGAHDWKVDYVITHTCSNRVLPLATRPVAGWEHPEHDRLTDFFDELEDKLEFERWYFGHMHRDRDCDERHTLLYKDVIEMGGGVQMPGEGDHPAFSRNQRVRLKESGVMGKVSGICDRRLERYNNKGYRWAYYVCIEKKPVNGMSRFYEICVPECDIESVEE